MIDATELPEGSDEDIAFSEITSAPDEGSAPEPVAKEQAPREAAPLKTEPTKAEPERSEKSVPLSELIAERRQRQAYERQTAELIEALNRAAPKPEPAPQPEIWDDPNQYVRQLVQPEFEKQYRAQMYNARLIAEARFGEDKVNAAQEAFDSLLRSNQLHPSIVEQVMTSPNPFAEAIKWYANHQIVSEVGGDPEQYRKKLRAQLMEDPEFRAEAMAAWQAQANANVRSTGRTPINLPSISRVGAAALPNAVDTGDPENDWSDITSRKRR
jgi:hypothetical protein